VEANALRDTPGFRSRCFGFKLKDGKTFCRHNVWQWDECVDCYNAILEFERKAGRNPLDPRQALRDRLDECTVERDKARKMLAELESPISGWRLSWIAVLSAGIVYAFSYISLAAAIAAATFCIILTMIMLVEGERRARLAIREAQRNLDEWERRWSRADRALEDD
jgi:hypothetical protein